MGQGMDGFNNLLMKKIRFKADMGSHVPVREPLVPTGIKTKRIQMANVVNAGLASTLVIAVLIHYLVGTNLALEHLALEQIYTPTLLIHSSICIISGDVATAD